MPKNEPGYSISVAFVLKKRCSWTTYSMVNRIFFSIRRLSNLLF